MIRTAFTISLVFICTFINAQNIVVKGAFLKDSVKVGEHLHFSLCAVSNSSDQLVFPNETYAFTPFEFIEKKAFSTVTHDSTQVKDSAIYTLRTFEMDSALILQLPVYKITAKGDSISYFHEPQEIKLKRVITSPPSEIKVKETTAYQEIPLLTNWPLWTTILITLTIVLGIVLIFTGKPILRYFAIRRLTKKHQKFLLKFETSLQALAQQNGNAKPAPWLQEWKDHTGYLAKKPLKSYTTKDFKAYFPEETPLVNSLSTIDGVIYGGVKASNLPDAASELKTFAHKLFEARIEQIKHG